MTSISAKIVKLGDMLIADGATPDAVAEIGDAVHVEAFEKSGRTVEQEFARLKTSKPHYWPDAESAEGRKHLAASTRADLEKAAFGPDATLAAQGVLVKKIGLAAAAERAAAWRTRLGSLTAGSNPNKAADEDADAAREADKKTSKNPWIRGDVDAMASFIKRAGTKAAREMAAKAGTDIAGRPLATA